MARSELEVKMVDFATLPGCGPVVYNPELRPAAERQDAEAVLSRIPGVQGVGEGQDASGDPAWIAYVRDGSVSSRLPSKIGDKSVVPLTTGEISIRPVR